jgi:hypothetical protein
VIYCDISAADDLQLDSSACEVDRLSLGMLIEVMAVIDDQHS